MPSLSSISFLSYCNPLYANPLASKTYNCVLVVKLQVHVKVWSDVRTQGESMSWISHQPDARACCS